MELNYAFLIKVDEAIRKIEELEKRIEELENQQKKEEQNVHQSDPLSN